MCQIPIWVRGQHVPRKSIKQLLKAYISEWFPKLICRKISLLTAHPLPLFSSHSDGVIVMKMTQSWLIGITMCLVVWTFSEKRNDGTLVDFLANDFEWFEWTSGLLHCQVLSHILRFFQLRNLHLSLLRKIEKER